jgi:hypothetical protein
MAVRLIDNFLTVKMQVEIYRMIDFMCWTVNLLNTDQYKKSTKKESKIKAFSEKKIEVFVSKELEKILNNVV